MSNITYNRRKVLTLTVAGIVTPLAASKVPATWSKPLVSSVLLPVHAATSQLVTPMTPPPADDGGDQDGGVMQGSDIRLKTDIDQLGTTPDGFQLYRFAYRDDPDSVQHVGVMAQDLIDSYSDAIALGDDGFYRVNYQSLGLQMTTVEEYERRGVEAVLLSH